MKFPNMTQGPYLRSALILLLGVFVGVGITLERAVHAERETTKVAEQPLPVDELRTLAEVFSRIKADYVEPVDDKKILRDAIQGMLAGLDPHSSYLDPEGYKEIHVSTGGEFGGLGIEVTMEDGFVKVVSPIEDTPAARAGLKTGDLIIRLDSKAVKGMSLNDAVKMMRGKPGSNITLTVVREGSPKPLTFTLTRAVIKIQSVKHRMLEDGFGYLRITQFQANTGDSVKEALNKLKLQHKNNLKGLVLDLRNNPGGVLSAAVQVSDAFLTSGLIVYTEGRTADSELRLSATPADLLNGAPMVVLVNGGSASASEIVAGALQDHKRALVVGTQSFGKGSVQTILPLNNGTAIKLTTARYFTPNGRSIQAKGITPDITVEEATVSANDGPKTELREADLDRHLINNQDSAAKSDKPKDAKKDKTGKPSIEPGEIVSKNDYQFNQALILLKGLHLLQNR